MLRRSGVMHLVISVVLLSCSLAANAVTYQYQGNQFDFAGSTITNPCDPGAGGCLISDVTVSLEFSSSLAASMALAPVAPDAWSISDGLTLVTDATPGIATTPPNFQLQVGTDALGNINEWFIDINPTSPATVSAGEWSGTRTIDSGGFISDQTRYCQSGSCSFQGLALMDDNPGSWTTIPLPAGVWLFAGALGALFSARRKIAH